MMGSFYTPSPLAPDDIIDGKGPDFVVCWFSREPVQIASDVLRLHRTPYVHTLV